MPWAFTGLAVVLPEGEGCQTIDKSKENKGGKLGVLSFRFSGRIGIEEVGVC